MEGDMFDMGAISPELFNASDDSPLYFKGGQEDTSVSNGTGFQYWEEDRLSDGCCFDLYAWSKVK